MVSSVKNEFSLSSPDGSAYQSNDAIRPFQLSAISDSNDLIASAASSSSSSPAAASVASPPGGAADRPHTISSAYEKGAVHQRPQLTPYTFEQVYIIFIYNVYNIVYNIE